jgi:hypothetical protein
VVESQPSKLLVAGSIPVSRSSLRSQVTRRLSAEARSAKVDVTRATAGRPARANAVSERACRGVWRGEAPQKADVAQLAERVLGKDEVTSSILVIGSSLRRAVAIESAASARQASQR